MERVSEEGLRSIIKGHTLESSIRAVAHLFIVSTISSNLSIFCNF